MPPDLPAPIKLVGLIRHAKTRWNEERRIQGWSDSPLSAVGREQAESWAPALAGMGFERIVSSDLGRARQTADLINELLDLPISEDRRLRERDFGALEGADVSCWPGRGDPPNGERLDQVRARALAAVGDLAGYNQNRILVVSHHGVLESLLTYLAGPDHPAKNGRLLKSYRLHWLGVGDNAVGLIRLNEKISL